MNIVVLDGHVINPGDLSWAPLEALGTVTVYERTAPENIFERARAADILLTHKVHLTAEMLAQLPALQYIGILDSECDVVDLAAATARGISVCNLVAYAVDDVAQHVMALLLELCRHTTEHTMGIQHGDWNLALDHCYWAYPQQSLHGLTMGIIGFGKIGRRVGELAHAFGMNIMAVSHGIAMPPNYTPFSFAKLDDVLSHADVVSLHCPLTHETHGFISAARLAHMRPTALLINTANGGLLDEQAVATALHTGKLAGFATDVLSTEPPTEDNPLLHAPHVLITPHIAWATQRARNTMILQAAKNIQSWQNGTPCNVVKAL